MPRWIKIWAGFVALGFFLVFASYGAKPQADSADRNRLAEHLVNRLTALDRQLAFCHLALGCESTHKGIAVSIATVQKAKREGNDAALRRIAPLVDEAEVAITALIPNMRGVEEMMARVKPRIDSYLRNFDSEKAQRESQERVEASKKNVEIAKGNLCRGLEKHDVSSANRCWNDMRGGCVERNDCRGRY